MNAASQGTGAASDAAGSAPSALSELHFSVRDTGIGIPADRLGRLFQSFSQVDASTTRQYGGTGLGLAISKRLCEMMGGSLWVESVPGVGSCFQFTIHAPAVPAPLRIYLAGRQPQIDGKRILIVDDNSINCSILSTQAESWGMQTVVAVNGREALERLEAEAPFDIAILDMQMPEMDGLMLAATIREHARGRELPLVLLTSLGQVERGGSLDSVRFAAQLTKPIKAAALYEVVLTILADRTASRSHANVPTGATVPLADRLPLRILVAEDNPVNQKVTLRMLEKMGYRADLASNGLEAVEAVRRQPYDIVLMDVQMPEMDGLEAARAICDEWAEAERPRIVAMTAGAMEGDRQECLAAGMVDYVSKPVKLAELAEALERCVIADARVVRRDSAA